MGYLLQRCLILQKMCIIDLVFPYRNVVSLNISKDTNDIMLRMQSMLFHAVARKLLAVSLCRFLLCFDQDRGVYQG